MAWNVSNVNGNNLVIYSVIIIVMTPLIMKTTVYSYSNEEDVSSLTTKLMISTDITPLKLQRKISGFIWKIM